MKKQQKKPRQADAHARAAKKETDMWRRAGEKLAARDAAAAAAATAAGSKKRKQPSMFALKKGYAVPGGDADGGGGELPEDRGLSFAERVARAARYQHWRRQ